MRLIGHLEFLALLIFSGQITGAIMLEAIASGLLAAFFNMYACLLGVEMVKLP